MRSNKRGDNTYQPYLMLACLALSGCATVQDDSVSRAEHIDASTAPANAMPEVDRRFLIDAVDARRMDREEGRLAAARGTTTDIRQYGAYMVSEQTDLLAKIEIVASEGGIAVPSVIGKEKSDALLDLSQLTGEKFDRQFISMITIDHRRDVKDFTAAESSPVRSVAAFAQAQERRIQMHLDQINNIKKDYDAAH